MHFPQTWFRFMVFSGSSLTGSTAVLRVAMLHLEAEICFCNFTTSSSIHSALTTARLLSSNIHSLSYWTCSFSFPTSPRYGPSSQPQSTLSFPYLKPERLAVLPRSDIHLWSLKVIVEGKALESFPAVLAE